MGDLRPATDADRPAINALLRLTLDAGDDPRYDEFLAWKHLRNPFGRSYEWVATSGDEVVGYRAFLRWHFISAGEVRTAVRAVDTATHPVHQGKGIFGALTMAAVEQMTSDGVDFVFNTPNDRSRPGYLKMGWNLLGRVPVRVRPSLPPRPRRLLSARAPASRFGLPVDGFPAFDPAALDFPTVKDGVCTHRTPEFLTWRYGLGSLGYRMALDEGTTAVFRLRARGRAREVTFSEVGGGRIPDLVRSVLRQTGADFATLPSDALSPWTVKVTRLAPALCVRDLASSAPDRLDAFSLSLGDLELF